MLIRYPIHSCGFGDIIRFCMTKIAMLEERKISYIPVIDLSVPGDKNQFSGGKAENIWEYYFEPLNEYRPEEVKESADVLVCEHKIDAFNPYEDESYVALVKQKMAEWNCDYLLVATEDMVVLRNFQDAGFGERLLYVEQERYEYPDIEKSGILVANLKKDGHDYRDEMPYLAVLYLLSECCSLIANYRCGAFEVADFINGNQYEHRYCCVEDAE